MQYAECSLSNCPSRMIANVQKQSYTVGGLDSSTSRHVDSGERIGNDAHESRWPANVQTDFAGIKRGTAATNRPRRSMGSAKEERCTERRSRFELPTLAHSGAYREYFYGESEGYNYYDYDHDFSDLFKNVTLNNK